MSSRRTFVTTTGAAALTQLSSTRSLANGKVRIAVLGVNGRGQDHIKAFSSLDNAEVVMLCDPDQSLLDKRSAEIATLTGKKVKAVQDLRRVMDSKEVDAVSIATPNHWHALAAIWACQAGKDVYVEKPGSHNIWEGRKMVEAAHKYNRIVQHGVQLRSSEALQEAVKHLRAGVIGKVYMARGLVYRNRPSIGKSLEIPVPSYIDYDLWTGPAQKRPFSKRLVHYNWHWHWDYGNGDVGNQGGHEADMCMWGLGVNSLPSKVVSMGGKFLFDDDKETPELLTSTYSYPDQKKIIQFEVRPWYTNTEDGVEVGNIFYGSEGYMLVKNYDAYETYLGPKKVKGPARRAGGNHFANFIKAVQSRKTSDQNGPVETAHLSSGLAHMGNIAYRLERHLTFDAKTEKFIGDSEANAMLKRHYRKPFEIPEKV